MYLSLGGDGALAGEGETLLRLPRREVRVVSTTGAGDAVTAALVWAGVRGLDLERSARFAQMAGAMTCECREANNPKLGELIRNSEFGIRN